MSNVRISFVVIVAAVSILSLTGCNTTHSNSGSINKGAKGQKPKIGVCPQDAKMCPDGSAVTRTGPNCTFPACNN